MKYKWKVNIYKNAGYQLLCKAILNQAEYDLIHCKSKEDLDELKEFYNSTWYTFLREVAGNESNSKN